MARDVHAVVRLDNVTGMIDGARIHSGRFVTVTTTGSGDNAQTTITPTAIDNGFPVEIGALEEGEREIRQCVTPTSSTKDWGIVTTPEVDDASTFKNYDLQDFYNKAGDAIRVHVLKDHNIFSVSQEALDGTPVVGDKIAFYGGTNGKWKVGNTGVATCIAIDVIGSATAFGTSGSVVAPVTLYVFEMDAE